MNDLTCTDDSLAADEPLAGSAPDAVAWVCLEQNGPWGKKAWTDSHLDPGLGARIEALADQHGVRPSLVRRPGKHVTAQDAPRQVLIAHTRPGATWLLTGTVASPEELLDLDWAAVASGDRDAVLRSAPGLAWTEDPVLLVCTNGTRDACCARLGRPVALAAALIDPEHVWEVTHTSGHRFAATTVLLPAGVLHGRVLDGTGILAAAARGQLTLTGYRGRSTFSAGAQVAEEHIRRTEGVLGLDDLDVVAEVDAWSVRHRDGRRWWVAVSRHDSGERRVSCGKDPEPVTRWSARTVSTTTTGP